MANWFYCIDWQAVGTWIMAAVLGFFAWKTWQVSRQQSNLNRGQFKVQYEPDLLCDPTALSPEVGSVIKTSIGGSEEFDGIAWNVRLFNPGRTVIALRKIEAYLVNIDNNRRIPLGGAPTFFEAVTGTPDRSIELPADLHIMVCDEDFVVLKPAEFPIYMYPEQASPLNIGLWVYEEVTPLRSQDSYIPGTALRRDIELNSSGTSYQFRLIVTIRYDWLSTKRSTEEHLTSLPFTLSESITFRKTG
jgi:hypothetical protein